MYDLVNYQVMGVNRAKRLTIYSRIKDGERKELLSFMSAFQVYCGRRSH